MKILHIIPYTHLYPPKNGGQLRCFHILEQLSKYFEVDVICYQTKESIYEKGYTNSKVHFYSPKSFKKPKTIASRLLPKKIYNAVLSRVISNNFFESATKEIVEFMHIIKALGRKKDYEYIILEHIRTLSVVPVLNTFFSKSIKILDAHNVDHLLLKKEDNQYLKILKKESRLSRYVDLFWACSTRDKEILEELNKRKLKGYVVPNGVAINKSFKKNSNVNPKNLLFCGSLDYTPNKNGLLWFYNNVWQSLKEEISDIKLTVIGRGAHSGYEDLINDNNIDFIGEVDDVTVYYKANSIAIVPLFEGSGTRLKVLEAMGYKTAVITTTKGIEGIEYSDGVHAITVDVAKDFIKAIISLIEDGEKRNLIVKNAKLLIHKKYSWDKVGERIFECLS